MAPSTRERLVSAAFELFADHGYEATTIEQIAAQAGVGRTTFFRNFGRKEDVLFPHHEDVLADVDARLATATATTRSSALSEAARIVLDHYIAEGETARRRYRLTSTVLALHEREMAAVQRYHRVFARHISGWLAGEPDSELRAELTAAAVITAHNHVLRNWLRGGGQSRVGDDFDDAMALALGFLSPPSIRRTVVVVTQEIDVESVIRDVRKTLEDDRRTTL